MAATSKTPSRLESLNTWLDEINARLLWDVKGPSGSTILGYTVNGRCLIVHRYADRGWEIYRPASEKNNIAATLDAAAEFCGVDQSGLWHPEARPPGPRRTGPGSTRGEQRGEETMSTATSEKPYHTLGRVHYRLSRPFATEDAAIAHSTEMLGRYGEIHDVVRKDGKTLTITWKPDSHE